MTATTAQVTIHLGLTTKDKVLPCPFCGSENIELVNTWTPAYWVQCNDCNAEAHGQSAWKTARSAYHRTAHEKAKASALAAWNRRAR